MVRRMAMVLVVMSSCLLAGHVKAQDVGCLATVNYLGQSAAQIAAAAYADALDSYACALEADPLNEVARIGQLQTALLVGDYLTAYGDAVLLSDGSFLTLDTAIATQTEILRGHPNNVNAYQVRAFLYLFSGQPGIAHADAIRILQLEPDNAFAYLIQAASSETIGNTDEAGRAFEMAAELAPDNAQIYSLMAAAQLEASNLAGVVANSSRAIELDPTQAYAYYLRGMTRLATANPEEALADANRAIALNPTYYGFYILRARADLALGDPQSAFADLSTAIELDPHTVDGHATRAEVSLALGQVEAAQQDFATAVELQTLETVEGDALSIGEPVIVNMRAGRTYHLPFQALAGQIATIRATSVNPGEVDPLVQIITPGGQALEFNDNASDQTMDAFLAGVEILEDGTYTVVLGDANGGSPGAVSLSVDLHWRCCLQGSR